MTPSLATPRRILQRPLRSSPCSATSLATTALTHSTTARRPTALAITLSPLESSLVFMTALEYYAAFTTHFAAPSMTSVMTPAGKSGKSQLASSGSRTLHSARKVLVGRPCHAVPHTRGIATDRERPTDRTGYRDRRRVRLRVCWGVHFRACLTRLVAFRASLKIIPNITLRFTHDIEFPTHSTQGTRRIIILHEVMRQPAGREVGCLRRSP